MKWTAKAPKKHVLNMLIDSHRKTVVEEKCSQLCTALCAGEQRLWWYQILKSYCADYKDGAIVGYDDPLPDIGLQGLKETDHGYVFFKKADTLYLGRAPMRYEAVKSLLGAIRE